MSTTIEVNKQSVKLLLESGQKSRFIIPEYQRPYEWSIDEVETLFNDLWNFTENKGYANPEATYFLGSVVSYIDKSGEQAIIDGQQRITSLFLLLRAIYTKLQEPDVKSKEAQNFLDQIKPAIWKKDILTGDVDYKNILLKSSVINNKGNQILKNILETGKTEDGAKDNYSLNYNKFQELFDKSATENAMLIYHFIHAVLNQAILLPIIADNQETALTIFSTLNDRGLPLSDADIFKAEIYSKLDETEKKEFINDWKNLEENSSLLNESIQSLFYYYMFYLRAKEADNKSTTPGLRSYFLAEKASRLRTPNLLDDLSVVLNLWRVVNGREEIEDEKWSKNSEILRALDILSSYPNEFWKYPVVIYYLVHKNESDFDASFLSFLRKLIVELLTKYLVNPTINAVKGDILKLNVEIIKNAKPEFNFKDVDKNILASNIKAPNGKIVRMLLKLLAYNHQTDLLPEKWEIEHIFPQKWQENFFLDEKDDVIREKIEFIGNKVPFEKKLNIRAGNGYFNKKKSEYKDSKIVIARELANLPDKDWSLEDITERGVLLSNELMEILEKWNKNYLCNNKLNVPSEEEQKMIELFKQKGWV